MLLLRIEQNQFFLILIKIEILNTILVINIIRNYNIGFIKIIKIYN